MTTDTTYPSVLLIYTGGTIGMIRNSETGALESFTFDHLVRHIPELKQMQCRIDSVQFEPPIDSSDMDPSLWVDLARIIHDNYDRYDGFVVLHGSDTMSYTASAMSFALENLDKPVIFTGSQLPIGVLRTDGKENLITAIEIATAKRPDGTPMVPEVCILFQDRLLRGNRTTKVNAENFNAFKSHNYPNLADVGVHINYYTRRILPPRSIKPLKPHFLFDTNVIVLTLFPGIQEHIVTEVLKMEGLKAVVMKTFGTGNAPQREYLRTMRFGFFVVCTSRTGSHATGTGHHQYHPVSFGFGRYETIRKRTPTSRSWCYQRIRQHYRSRRYQIDVPSRTRSDTR